MVLHKDIDGEDTRFFTMTVPLVKNSLGRCIGVIRIGTYQAAAEDIRWAYEQVQDLWPDIDPNSDSSDDGFDDK